jgi:DNA ligase (NAD+)
MKEKMRTLIELLNSWTEAYDMGKPIVSDEEWDNKYFELVNLERESNFSFPDSPTQNVNFTIVNKLEKVAHNHKMLSLEKTKDIEDIDKFFGNKDYVAMCKMDGLTCSLTYKNGILVSAETRGNGSVGENILHNAMVIPSIPKRIKYKETFVVDGEIICTAENFKQFEDKYENPRNFAAGSIRLLNSKECHSRNLTFVAWEIIEGYENISTLVEKLTCLEELGFEFVPYAMGTIDFCINILKEEAKKCGYPIDGIVFKFNDIEYGNSLGATDHHFKNAIAFKFYDERFKTYLKDIEWSIGRTGVLTPIAIYEPVDDGISTFERASLHNVSVMESLFNDALPYKGQPIWVGKSNQIIPQVFEVEELPIDEEVEFLFTPLYCPICGELASIEENEGVKILVCGNPNCEGKMINRLNHFCGKNGLDIKGLSKATLEKLMEWEWIENIIDIFSLKEHRTEWIQKAGFGPKSVDNILNAIEEAKTTTIEAFISSLGIPLIGKVVAADLMKHFKDYHEFREAVNNKFDFSKFESFAESKTEALWNYDYTEADKIFKLLILNPKEEKVYGETCANLKFVITGKLTKFKNRNEFKELIEINGGKVIDSVSKNTSYLINNDITSTSGKNKEAQKLGIPIISEEEFFEKFFKNS